MRKTDKILVTASTAMIGAATVRRLRETGFTSLVTAEIDWTDQKKVFDFFKAETPDYVFLNSVKIGGIQANSRYPADFIYLNMQSEANIIHAAWKSGVNKLLYCASACIYPVQCPQPIKEEYLMTGSLEPTYEPYATAKIAGIRMCQAYRHQYGINFISVVPPDLYGPLDDFDPENGHVLPALLARMHRAKLTNQPEVVVWGTGTPRRETLHVDDLADACIFLMDNYSNPELINAGSGADIAVKDLAVLIGKITGFQGRLAYNTAKPDGALRKLLDNSKIKELGWSPKIGLEEGIKQTYEWFKKHKK